MRRAFTLIELLVVIVIVSILLSLALPALAGARRQAKATVAIANGRTVGTTFNQYADEFGAYPFADDTKMPLNMPQPPRPGIMHVPWFPVGAIIGTSEPWHLSSLWAGLVGSAMGWQENYAAWVSPGLSTALPEVDPGSMIFTDALEPHVSWRYSNAFIARPKVWDADNPPAGADWPKLWKSCAPADVLFPADKVLLWDADLAYIHPEPKLIDDHYDHTTPMVFADGHADLLNPQKASAPVRNPFSGSQRRLHDTPNGIRGRDY